MGTRDRHEQMHGGDPNLPPGPPGQVPPGQVPPGQVPPYGQYPPYPQGGYPPPANNNAGKVVLIVVGVFLAMGFAVAIVSIAAVTLLGKNASSKFSSVAVAIPDPSVSTTGQSGSGPSGGPPSVAPPAAGATVTGTTPCPAADGSSARTTTFAQAPPMCIDPAKTYTATFDTTMGTIVVKLDAAGMPSTTNNFVVLARYHYYDDTAIFRLDPSIDIMQGGSPTTNSASDPGPGYTIKDEGKRFTYATGDLVMARTGAPNSSGAQFFMATGPKVTYLNSQGTYLLFGKTTSGEDVLGSIAALYQPFPAGSANSGLGGAPSKPVVVNSVTISES